jgi:hypothetical protein
VARTQVARKDEEPMPHTPGMQHTMADMGTTSPSPSTSPLFERGGVVIGSVAGLASIWGGLLFCLSGNTFSRGRKREPHRLLLLLPCEDVDA